MRKMIWEKVWEIIHLFPSILSFLDLSTLGLKESVSKRLPLPLLHRQEDKDLTRLIKKKPENSGGSVMVTGHPGTGEFLVSHLTGSNQPYHYQGKTAYIYLRIIENMIEGRPFLFQVIDGTIYHIAEKGVEAVQSWSSKERIEAFVDGDKKKISSAVRRCSQLWRHPRMHLQNGIRKQVPAHTLPNLLLNHGSARSSFELGKSWHCFQQLN